MDKSPNARSKGNRPADKSGAIKQTPNSSTNINQGLRKGTVKTKP